MFVDQIEQNLPVLLDDQIYGRIFSFDVFDTALIRRVDSPDDSYMLIGREFEKMFGIEASAAKSARRRAENEARQLNWIKGSHEITLDEVYELFCEIVGISENMRSALIDVELKIESSLMKARPDILYLYKRIKNSNFKAIFVSDTFYPRSFIQDILEREGFTDALVFASSDARVTKAERGKLFEMVIEALNVRPSNIIHLGDNLISDVRIPLSMGIKAQFVAPVKEIARKKGFRFRKGSSLISSVAQSLVNQKSAECSESFNSDMFGYCTLGPLWLGFVGWIMERSKANNIDKIFFLSRDGHILRRVAKEGFGVEHEYMYVSRATLYLAFAHINFKEAVPLLVQNYTQRSFVDVITRLLPDDCNMTEISQGSWWEGDLFRPVENAEDIELLKAICVDLKEYISRKAAETYRLITKYFSSLGLEKVNKIGIVDVGWHGSLQRLMQSIFESIGLRCEITGFYLGIFSTAKPVKEPHRMLGYLCEFGMPGPAQNSVMQSPSLIEVLHSAPHGSVIGYQDNEKGINAILRVSQAEIRQYSECISIMQDSAIQFIKDVFSVVQNDAEHVSKELSPEEASLNLFRVLSSPTLDEAKNLGRFVLSPDFGPSSREIALASSSSEMQSLWPAGTRMLMQDTIPDWFNEAEYLKANPDVAEAVRNRIVASGYEHYCVNGKSEGRPLRR